MKEIKKLSCLFYFVLFLLLSCGADDFIPSNLDDAFKVNFPNIVLPPVNLDLQSSSSTCIYYDSEDTQLVKVIVTPSSSNEGLKHNFEIVDDSYKPINKEHEALKFLSSLTEVSYKLSEELGEEQGEELPPESDQEIDQESNKQKHEFIFEQDELKVIFNQEKLEIDFYINEDKFSSLRECSQEA